MLLPAGVNASPRMELAEKKDPESNFDTFSNVLFHFSSLRLFIYYMQSLLMCYGSIRSTAPGAGCQLLDYLKQENLDTR